MCQLHPLAVRLLGFGEFTAHVTDEGCSPWVPRAGPYPLDGNSELRQQESRDRTGNELLP